MSEFLNANERAFLLIREFLIQHAASDDLHEALDGLELRYRWGRDANRERLRLWRIDRAKLLELEGKPDN